MGAILVVLGISLERGKGAAKKADKASKKSLDKGVKKAKGKKKKSARRKNAERPPAPFGRKAVKAGKATHYPEVSGYCSSPNSTYASQSKIRTRTGRFLGSSSPRTGFSMPTFAGFINRLFGTALILREIARLVLYFVLIYLFMKLVFMIVF